MLSMGLLWRIFQRFNWCRMRQHGQSCVSLNTCYTSCISCQSASGFKLRCWLWPVKPFMQLGWIIVGCLFLIISAHLIRSGRRGMLQVLSTKELHLVGSRRWAFSAVASPYGTSSFTRWDWPLPCHPSRNPSKSGYVKRPGGSQNNGDLLIRLTICNIQCSCLPFLNNNINVFNNSVL